MTRRPQIAAFTAIVLLSPLACAQRAQVTSGADLAKVNRSTWVAAIAAACDTIAVDSTWRLHQDSNARVTIRLPPAFSAQGNVLPGWFYDAGPGVPPKQYLLLQYDPITSQLVLREATVSFHCRAAARRAPSTVESIWVAGYDYRPRETGNGEYGVWYVFASFHVGQGDRQWLYGMSRDLWGARALVTAMRHAVLIPIDWTRP